MDLLDSLREAVDYATTAGLLKKDALSALDVLEVAEFARQRGERIDEKAVRTALNDMAVLIAPLSLADLEFGRNPLSPNNQARTRKLEFWLPVLALVLLLTIGYFMESLRDVHSFLARVELVKAQNPEHKLAELQQMILYDEPFAPGKPRDTMRVEYLERVADLQRMSAELGALGVQARELDQPGVKRLESLLKNIRLTVTGKKPETEKKAPAQKTKAVDENKANAANVKEQENANKREAAAEKGPAALKAHDEAMQKAKEEAEPVGVCAANKDGSLKMDKKYADWPPWMKNMKQDELSIFCFQQQLRTRLGATPANMNLVVDLISKTPKIRERTHRYSDWYLPFLYGLLGSMLYMMRKVGNIRLPAQQLMSILMRISLGGMAGIMIGWFAIGDPGSRAPVGSAIAWPFVLAFVAGYGIDVLFSILDRMNRVITDNSTAKRDSSPA